MKNNLSQALSTFSEKLKAFNKSGKTERVVPPTRDDILQAQIRERSERLKSSVVQTYRIFKAPFEALGDRSERAAGLDRDEQALQKAYDLFKSVMDIKSEDDDDVETTFISKVEIASPLTQKASYTSGGQFIYLQCWLYFEQGCQEFFPQFVEQGNSFSLVFVKQDDFEFDGHDKEIFEIVRKEFYS